MEKLKGFFTFIKDRINEGEQGGLFTDSEDSDNDPIQVPKQVWTAVEKAATFVKERVLEGEHGGLFTDSETSDDEIGKESSSFSSEPFTDEEVMVIDDSVEEAGLSVGSVVHEDVENVSSDNQREQPSSESGIPEEEQVENEEVHPCRDFRTKRIVDVQRGFISSPPEVRNTEEYGIRTAKKKEIGSEKRPVRPKIENYTQSYSVGIAQNSEQTTIISNEKTKEKPVLTSYCQGTSVKVHSNELLDEQICTVTSRMQSQNSLPEEHDGKLQKKSELSFHTFPLAEGPPDPNPTSVNALECVLPEHELDERKEELNKVEDSSKIDSKRKKIRKKKRKSNNLPKATGSQEREGVFAGSICRYTLSKNLPEEDDANKITMDLHVAHAGLNVSHTDTESSSCLSNATNEEMTRSSTKSNAQNLDENVGAKRDILDPCSNDSSADIEVIYSRSASDTSGKTKFSEVSREKGSRQYINVDHDDGDDQKISYQYLENALSDVEVIHSKSTDKTHFPQKNLVMKRDENTSKDYSKQRFESVNEFSSRAFETDDPYCCREGVVHQCMDRARSNIMTLPQSSVISMPHAENDGLTEVSSIQGAASNRGSGGSVYGSVVKETYVMSANNSHKADTPDNFTLSPTLHLEPSGVCEISTTRVASNECRPNMSEDKNKCTSKHYTDLRKANRYAQRTRSNSQHFINFFVDDTSDENEDVETVELLDFLDDEDWNPQDGLYSVLDENNDDDDDWYDDNLDRKMKKVQQNRAVQRSNTWDFPVIDESDFFYETFFDDSSSSDEDEEIISKSEFLRNALINGLSLDEEFVDKFKHRSSRTCWSSNQVHQKDAEQDELLEGTAYIEDENNAYVICDKDDCRIRLSGSSTTMHCFTSDKVLVEVIDSFAGNLYGRVRMIKERKRHKDVEHPVFLCSARQYSHSMVPVCKTVPKLHALNKYVMQRMPTLSSSKVDVYNYDPVSERLKFSRIEDLTPNTRRKRMFVVVLIHWKDDKPSPLGAVIDVIKIKSADTCLELLNLQYEIPESTLDFVQDSVLSSCTSTETGKVTEIFTIDKNGSRLLDDGFSLEHFRENQGKIECTLGIHITDVARFVERDDIRDKAAREKVKTVHRGKQQNVHLLPWSFVLENCSLNENKERMAFSLFFNVKIHNDEECKIDEISEVKRTKVVSIKHYTYDSVDEMLLINDDTRYKKLRCLQQIAFVFRQQRLKETFCGYKKLKAHDIVEEMMIMMGYKIADFVLRQNIDTRIICRRLHSSRGSGVSLTEDSDVGTFSTESAISINVHVMRNLLEFSNDFLSVQDVSGATSCSRAFVQDDRMRSRAEYIVASEATDQTEHSDLQRNPYTHCTSPMRRYVDIVVQRIVSSILISESCFPYTEEELESLCQHLNTKQVVLAEYEKKVSDIELSNQLLSQSKRCLATVTELCIKSGFKLCIADEEELETSLEVDFTGLDLVAEPVECSINATGTGSFSSNGCVCKLRWKKRIYCTYPPLKKARYFPVFSRRYPSKVFEVNPYQNSVLVPYFLYNEIINGIDSGSLMSIRRKILRKYRATATDDIQDIRSDEDEGLIFKHKCEITMTIFVGQEIPVQLTTELRNGTLVPIVQILSLTPNFQVCVQHIREPIRSLTLFATLRSRPKYKDIKQYTHIWGRIVNMESTLNTVKEEDNPIICGINLKFKGNQGYFSLSEEFCVIHDIDLQGLLRKSNSGQVKNYEEVLSRSYLCIRCSAVSSRKNNTSNTKDEWVGHAAIYKIKKVSEEHPKSDGENGKTKAMYRICFVLHPESPITAGVIGEQVLSVTDARIELLLKSSVDRRTEFFLQELQHDKKIAVAVALGREIPPLGPDHRRKALKVSEVVANDPDLNEQQVQAIKRALRSSFSLIQGPPRYRKDALRNTTHMLFPSDKPNVN